MYFLGIDGGGTKTAFEIVDEKGNILSLLKTTTCDYLQVGKESFGRVIGEGAAGACEKAGISLSDICFSCIGIPSFGEIASDVPELVSNAKKALLSDRVDCVNDVEVAWAGSLACEPGINILAGTGSMAYGVDQKNNSARVGGWGCFCGDEGSAYWLGKKLIELFTKQADGRIPKGKTYDIVYKEFGLTSDFDFISVVLNKLECRRDEIARLQLLLNEAADQGDIYAVELYRQAACELGLIVSAIIGKLDFNAGETIAVSYSGGVFKAGDLIFAPFKESLKNYDITYSEPLLSPVSGAALKAMHMNDRSQRKAIVENLRGQERNMK